MHWLTEGLRIWSNKTLINSDINFKKPSLFYNDKDM